MKVLTYVTKYGHIFHRPFAKATEQQENMDFDAMARRMYEALKPEAPFEEFAQGMKEEMEHDDITGGDLGLTGKIVMAHLKEDANYYSKLSAAMKKGGPGSGRYPEGSGKEPSEDMNRRFNAIADKHVADKPKQADKPYVPKIGDSVKIVRTTQYNDREGKVDWVGDGKATVTFTDGKSPKANLFDADQVQRIDADKPKEEKPHEEFMRLKNEYDGVGKEISELHLKLSTSEDRMRSIEESDAGTAHQGYKGAVEEYKALSDKMHDLKIKSNDIESKLKDRGW